MINKYYYCINNRYNLIRIPKTLFGGLMGYSLVITRVNNIMLIKYISTSISIYLNT